MEQHQLPLATTVMHACAKYGQRASGIVSMHTAPAWLAWQLHSWRACAHGLATLPVQPSCSSTYAMPVIACLRACVPALERVVVWLCVEVCTHM